MKSIRLCIALAAAAFAGLAGAAEPIKIGFSMALTGALAGAGKGALIAMEIWRDDINKKGGLLGRQVEFVYYDDATQPAKVPPIYTKLLNVDKVDLVVSSYGTNEIVPAMPIVMRSKMVFPSLFGLAANEEFKYDRYFQIMPAGPHPKTDWSRGFFELAAQQKPKPQTVAARRPRRSARTRRPRRRWPRSAAWAFAARRARRSRATSRFSDAGPPA